MVTSLFKFLSLAALVVATVDAATVITPTSLTACQNANIAWSGAQGKVGFSPESQLSLRNAKGLTVSYPP